MLKEVKEVISELMYYIKLYKIPNIQQKKKLLTCFSENGDLLSQWRVYGNDGFGVALGFNSESFCIFKNGSQYEFTKVLYDIDKTKTFLHQVIDESFKYIIIDCIEQNTIKKGLFDLKLQVSMLIDSIYQEGFIFKNYHFHEENEWRLYRNVGSANYCESNGIDDYGYSEFIEGVFSDNTQYVGDFSRSKLKFKATNCDIKCYTEIRFERIKSKIIKEIILGPKCRIDPFDLKICLAENKYIDNVMDDSLSIIHSAIPYI